MAAPPRVVLDTNVVVSALIFGGKMPTALRHAWLISLCTPLLSQATAAELIRLLAYPKFRLLGTEQQELLGDYAGTTKVGFFRPSLQLLQQRLSLISVRESALARKHPLKFAA